jgi:carbon-monoxide dehydrogenase small subunit
MILAACDLLGETPDPSEEEVRRGIEGNVCRCTGYEPIVLAVRKAAGVLREAGLDPLGRPSGEASQ